MTKIARRIFSTTIFLITCAAVSSAQNYVELINAKYDWGAPSNFEGSRNNTTIIQAYSDFLIPIPVSEKLAVLAGYTYSQTSVRLLEGAKSELLVSNTAKIGLNYSLSEKWKITAFALPKLTGSSSTKLVDKKGFQIGGVVLVKKVINPNRNYRAGLYMNSEQFGPFMVPIAGFYSLSSDEKWEWTVMAPISMDVNRKLSPKWFAGLNYLGQVRSFQLNENQYVVKTSNEPHLYIRYAPKGRSGLCLEAGVGRSLGRSYRVFDNEDTIPFGFPLIYFNDHREQRNTDFKDGIIYRFRARYRIAI